MKMKKLMCLIVSFMLAGAMLTATACDGGNSTDSGGFTGNETEIIIELDSGGVGTEWVVKAGERFSKLNANKSYAEGKKGVKITPKTVNGVNLNGSETSGTAIFDLSGVASINTAAGKVLNLDDLVKEKYDTRKGQSISIEDKIDESARARYKIGGEYYALPSIEFYPGMAYDINLFDDYGFYFASPDYKNPDRRYMSSILGEEFYFIEVGEDLQKSVGPDGKAGTADDGLPSSLYELIALCEYMSNHDAGVIPLSFTGQYAYYSNFMIEALTVSMLGWERAQTLYTFNGELEVVTGFSEENLFPGATGGANIKKPITKKVQVTEECGYYTSWIVEKYYAEAFMELAIANGWFGSWAENTGFSQKDAMNKFVMSGLGSADKIGMHIDGSFWYNEANTQGYFEDRDKLQGMAGGLNPREVGWMSLPVNYSETVTEGNGKGQVFVEMWRSMLVINKNIENNDELREAAQDFVKFIYSDAELSAYTALTSIKKSLNYEISDSDSQNISSYGKQLLGLVNDPDNHVLYFEGNNATFEGTPDRFVITSWANGYGWVGELCYYKARTKNAGKYPSVMDTFKQQSISKTAWSSLYRGSGTVGGEYDKIN